MKTIYKDGKSCQCENEQLDAMISGGWSLTKDEPKPKTRSKTTKSRAVKTESD